MMDQIEAVRIGRLLKKTIFILIEISKKEQDDLKVLLTKYNHVFVQHEQMLVVDPEGVFHKLDVNPNAKPMK